MFRFALATTLATAEAGTLAVTWSDCGAKHATVTDVEPKTIQTGATETIIGTGTSDEVVTSAHFSATVSALGAELSSCEGDGTKDIVCNLPMGVGKITVKALSFPLPQGTVQIPVEVQTSSLIPASLANVDVHILATEQNGEDVICLDVHTAKQAEAVQAVAEASTLAVTWSDCGAKHATVTDVEPKTIQTGATETIIGTGSSDEVVTSAHFSATVSALGAELSSCEGDGTKDIVCNLPLGVGKITVKALSFPLPQGTVKIPVEVQTSSLIPASLANVDVHILATEQNGEDVICLDVHTAKQAEAVQAVAEASTLAVTWSDCGAKHATVTDVEPKTIQTGATETIIGTGSSDEVVTSAHFSATVSALGAELSSCEGDGTKDIVCNLPLGVGKITVKALSFPLPQGTVKIPVEVQTSSLIPASLANVDVHILATEQNGEDVICLDVHTAQQTYAVLV